MLKKLKKIPHYARKLSKEAYALDILRLVRHVKPKHWLIAFAAYADRRSTAVEMTHQLGMQDIQLLLKILPYREQRLAKNFYLWRYGNRTFCATYMQFIGIYAEYLSGLFDNLYECEWENKAVLDIGGFVGDSALYFLEKGASQVIIYEPLAENVVSLKYNLQPFTNKISIHQQAVAKEEGVLNLSSNTPGGSLGFGMEKGSYQIQCEGTTWKHILKQHRIDIAKIDCEGGEQYLVDVPATDLQAISYWIIETHSPEIDAQVRKKFQESGFDLIKEVTLTPLVRLLHFKK
ncbi:FkbM family methyltransferase [Candidatus Protochlamydia phocaeensis]|uniref:FkbM family methyltransferase n=1 Tax=Candidatus Protochlamydia phocaeensis TaxID=1414722 RepID=UPI000837ED5B|nr:FkbM family methyltransferase [Candidatus Protochlamydia phocaeensis]